jgi:hypothetical protein
MDDVIRKIEALARVANVVFGSPVAAALGHFLGKELFERGQLSAEQRAQIDANYADYAVRESRLEEEIAGDAG